MEREQKQKTKILKVIFLSKSEDYHQGLGWQHCSQSDRAQKLKNL
jgi:hypothetical protein